MPNGLALYRAWSSSPVVRFALDRVRGDFDLLGFLFFLCLSVYLIGELLLLRERDLAGTICLKLTFYVRRVLRIWPLYLVALLAGFIPGYADHAQRNAAFLSFLFLWWELVLHDL